ncbi:MAG: hypothetical protein E7633_00805 [Ruminococcaceae bacterium]|nr:hypothetical protein [Oscillospiraceae bacterium]
MFNILGVAATAFTVVFAVVFCLFILINVLRGLSKGIVATAVRTVFIFISGILSIFIAVPIGKTLSKIAIDFVNEFIGSELPEFKELMEISPVIEDLMVGIPAAIISPIIYVVIFLILLLIMLIPAHFVKKLINAKFPDIPKLGWAGALCGAVTGVMTFVFLFAPTVGVISMAGDMAGIVVNLFDENGQENEENIELPEDKEVVKPLSVKPSTIPVVASDGENLYEDVILPITDNFFIKFVSGIGGKEIFNSLTVFEVKGKSVSIAEEFSVMSNVISDLMPVLGGSEPSQWTDKEINGIKNAAENLGDSEIVAEMLADVLSAASKKWANDEEFLGIAMISTGKDSIDTFLKELFLSFSDSTAKTISKDFMTLADVLGVMLRYDMLSAFTSGDSDITQNLAKEGFISGLLAVVMENDRFSGVTASVINLGVHETLGILNVPETDSDVYDGFVENVAEAINDANENNIPIETLKNTIYKKFTDSGIKVEKDITDYVTEYLMLDFEGRKDVTPEEVGEFFSVAFAIMDKNDASELSNGNAKNEVSFIGNVTLLENTYSGAEALKLLFEDIIEKLEQNDQDASAFKDVDWESLSTLQDREIFKSDAVTAEKLKVSQDAITSLSSEELLEECKKIENIMQDIVTFTNSVSNSESDNIISSADVESLGKALNSLSDSKILDEVSDAIIESALRSDIVQNNISISDATIDSMLTSEETDFANILVTVQNTTNIIENIGKETSSDGSSPADKVDDQLDWILNDMTENTATVVGEIFDVQAVINLGIPEAKAQNIADAINVFFEKMAKAKPNTEDPEDKDVKASKTIFKFISALKTSGGNLFEETGLTVSETIHIFMDSEISRETLIAASYVDGKLVTDSFGLAEKVSKNDKNEAIDVLEAEVKANYKSAEDKTEYKKAVCAIGAILDVDVSESFDFWVK